jgi:hypothetical protein
MSSKAPLIPPLSGIHSVRLCEGKIQWGSRSDDYMAVDAGCAWDQFYDAWCSRKIDVVKYELPVIITVAIKPLQHRVGYFVCRTLVSCFEGL